MTAVRIVEARSAPDAAPVIAAAHLAEWGHLYPSSEVDTDAADLLAHVDDPASVDLRLTWFAVVDGEVVGSVSLRGGGEVEPVDAERFDGPWLANLYVDPAHRGHGIASALLDHAETAAAGRGVRRLRLVTSDAEEMYTARGWTHEAEVELAGHHAIVMVTTLAP